MNLKATAGFFLALFFVVPVRGADWTAESAPECDRLFQQTNGWTGADGDYAVTLANGRTLWLFSDTFIGEVRDGRRVHAVMIHNSAAWQDGYDPATARLQFFQGQSSDGKPDALIKPADGRGWFWLNDGAMLEGKLFLFLPQIESTGDNSVFGFRQVATWLGEISNPLAPPPQWQVTEVKIPFTRIEPDESRSFGSAVMIKDGFVYIYGTHERKESTRTMILGRAPEHGLGDFTAWEFYTGNGWSAQASAAAGLCDGMATEYSVSWSPSRQQYVLVYTENGLSEKILARTAPQPWGPWSPATVIYRCPEARWDKQIFCYAAKAHPGLTSGTNDKWLVTYAANSFDFSQIINDGRLYWPRFIRVEPK